MSASLPERADAQGLFGNTTTSRSTTTGSNTFGTGTGTLGGAAGTFGGGLTGTAGGIGTGGFSSNALGGQFGGINSQQQGRFFGGAGGSGQAGGNQFANQFFSGVQGNPQSAMDGSLRQDNERRFQADQANRQEQRTPIRISVTPKFRHPALPRDQVTSTISDRLSRFRTPRPERSRWANVPGTEHVEVRLTDRTATLMGRVATDDDRRLLLRFVGLEPGVSHVVDELVVDAMLSDPKPLTDGGRLSGRRGWMKLDVFVAGRGNKLFNPIPKGRLFPRDNTDLACGVGLNSKPFKSHVDSTATG